MIGQGVTILVAVRGLEALGCRKIIDVQSKVGYWHSEFEPLVVCFLRGRGMSTEELYSLVSVYSRCTFRVAVGTRPLCGRLLTFVACELYGQGIETGM